MCLTIVNVYPVERVHIHEFSSFERQREKMQITMESTAACAETALPYLTVNLKLIFKVLGNTALGTQPEIGFGRAPRASERAGSQGLSVRN